MKSPNKILNFIDNSFDRAKNTASNKITFKKIKVGLQRFFCDKRDYIFSKWKNSLDPKIKLDYNKIRNKIHKLLEYKRNNYYIKYIKNNFRNTRKIYKIFNEMFGRITLSLDMPIHRAFVA